jgi:hypothetical protein
MTRQMGGSPDLRQIAAELEQAKAAIPKGQPVPAELQQLLDMFETIVKTRDESKWRSTSGKKNRHGKMARKPAQSPLVAPVTPPVAEAAPAPETPAEPEPEAMPEVMPQPEPVVVNAADIPILRVGHRRVPGI